MKCFALFFSFYIFLLSLAPGMKGVELLKVGNLVEHYQLHQSRNQESSLLSFIQEHYFNSSIDYEKEHQEMPFKLAGSFVISLFIDNRENLNIDLFSFNEEVRSNQPIDIQDSYFFNSHFSIWNPPRI
jgi:hypothetical protein